MNDRDEALLRAVLGERVRDGFAPGFADRAVGRWRAARAAGESLDAVVLRGFQRLLPLAAAALLVLALHNLGYRDRAHGQSIAAALVGLGPTATAAPTLEDLYGLGTLPPLGGQ